MHQSIEQATTESTALPGFEAPPSPTDTFSDWYQAYPRKKCRADAEKAYLAALKIQGVTVEALVRARDAFLAELRTAGTELQFYPYPAGFLRRYLADYLSTPAPPAAPDPYEREGYRFYPGSGWVKDYSA
jgi:hypothetical protein